jgi:hypothetical protein
MSENHKKKQYAQIEKLLADATAAIDEAKKIADEHGLSFFWSPPAEYHGEGTGMGASYYGKTNGSREYMENEYYRKDGWVPSNITC